jgi:hypothetical protein
MANLVAIVMRGARAAIDVSTGPDDAGDNDEDAKDLDADADQMNPLASNRLEGRRGVNGSHALRFPRSRRTRTRLTRQSLL